MRWLYFDPNNQTEAAYHAATLEKIDRWWSHFTAKAADLDAHFSRNTPGDIPAWMESTLQSIAPEIMWEFGPAVHCKGHRLVITPEGRHDLRPLVDSILDRAPQLEGWEFYPYRLPESVEGAQQMVEARTQGNLQPFKARAAIGEHNRIDVTLYSPTCTEPDEPQASKIAFVALETLLGEEWLDQWLGCISVLPLPASKKSFFGWRAAPQPDHLLPLDRLHPTFAALIDSIQSQLPERPWCEYEPRKDDSVGPDGQPIMWSLFKLEPAQDEPAYQGTSDLFTAVTFNVPLWTASHRGPAFYSKRFSKHGETFCYLKIDGLDGLEGTTFDDRASIEDALDTAPAAQNLGCTIGGGSGLMYSYIDLALTDLPRAIAVIRAVLQQGHIGPRTWLLFCDDHLSQEWVGMYDHSPAPPLPKVE